MQERIPHGEGAEKKVYVHPVHPNQVVKEYRLESHSMYEVKARYYMGKLLHVLFPDIVPDTHLSAQEYREGRAKRTQIVQDVAERSEEHIQLNKLVNEKSSLHNEAIAELRSPILTSPQYKDFLGALKKLGIKADKLPHNFSLQDGTLAYLDSFNPWSEEVEIYYQEEDIDKDRPLTRSTLKINLDESVVKEYISTLGPNKKLAETCLARLHYLFYLHNKGKTA